MIICHNCHQESCDCEAIFGIPTRREFIGFTPDGYAPAIDLDRARACWNSLHSYRGNDPAWLAEWELTIPCGQCLEGYLKIKADNPPRFGTEDELFVWGCNIHNLVNEKLDRPIMSIEEARVIWNRPNPESSNDADQGQNESQRTSS